MTTFTVRRRGAKGPGRDPEGRMPLMDHLRELRKRVFVSVIALVPGVVLGWIFYDELVHFLSAPICDVDVGVGERNYEITVGAEAFERR